MDRLTQLLDSYLGHAREELACYNRRFIDEVPYSARPILEEVLGSFAASLDVLQITWEELTRVQPSASPLLRSPSPEDVVTIVDAEGRINYESENIADRLGVPASERIGHLVWEWIHPEDLPATRQRFREGLSGGGCTTRFEVRLRHQDGGWRRIEAVAHAIRRGDQAVGYVAHSHFLS